MKIINAIIFLIMLNACTSGSNTNKTTDSTYKTVVQQKSGINQSTYSGTLPCADCEGIDVVLKLNNDSTYIMNSVYKGGRVDSSNNHFTDTGKWIESTDTIYLSAKNYTTKYIKTDSTLTQLDGDGKLITGNLAPMFVLHKK